jgi:hypothetical protein
MDKKMLDKAEEVLKRSQLEIIGELARAGESGGTGRAQNYAPILVSVTNALKAVQELNPKEDPAEFGKRMAEARAAKKTQNQ